MNSEELKEKPAEELKKILDDKRAELSKFRFDIGFGKNKNVKIGSSIKKDIARILTAINQKTNETI